MVIITMRHPTIRQSEDLLFSVFHFTEVETLTQNTTIATQLFIAIWTFFV